MVQFGQGGRRITGHGDGHHRLHERQAVERRLRRGQSACFPGGWRQLLLWPFVIGAKERHQIDLRHTASIGQRQGRFQRQQQMAAALAQERVERDIRHLRPHAKGVGTLKVMGVIGKVGVDLLQHRHEHHV